MVCCIFRGTEKRSQVSTRRHSIKEDPLKRISLAHFLVTFGQFFLTLSALLRSVSLFYSFHWITVESARGGGDKCYSHHLTCVHETHCMWKVFFFMAPSFRLNLSWLRTVLRLRHLHRLLSNGLKRCNFRTSVVQISSKSCTHVCRVDDFTMDESFVVAASFE